MIVLLQRVKYANVIVKSKIIGTIKQGILVFIAFQKHDNQKIIDRMIDKILTYRIFADSNDKMNLNIQDIAGELLLVPQFTLAADTNSGTRPSFSTAQDPKIAKEQFLYFVSAMQLKYNKIACGEFGANMEVNLCNDGPVTFWLENK
jgi:D-aminoacyl-tRNA deacylase